MKVARSAAIAGALLLTGAAAGTPAGADGTETLGTPSIAIADGSGITVAGTGLFVQPSSFDVEIPADATVTQALLYLEAGHRMGDTSGDHGDCTINVNAIPLACSHIGGPTPFFGDVITSTHRFDLTSLGLIKPGVSTLTIDGLDADEIGNGAGVVVIYREPGKDADVAVVDGNDIAFVNFAPPLDTTAPQTFTFAPAVTERTAQLGLIVNSIHDPVPQADPKHRPNSLLLTTGGVTTRIDEPFDDSQGQELDSGMVDVTIPANADSLTVQMVSEWDDTGDLPASLVWLTAALAVPTPPPAVAPQVTVAPTTIAPTTTTTQPPAVKTETAALPFTGGDPFATAMVGTFTFATGVAALLWIRRRPAPANRQR